MPSAEPAGVAGALEYVAPLEFRLGATDGYPLAARLWAPNDLSRPPVVALINAGAGIGATYYDRFARFLAEYSIPTFVYVYRGKGGSRPRSFRGRRMHLLEDLPAGVALEWANRRRAEFWWNLRSEDGEPDSVRIEDLLSRFHAIRAPTLALRFTDDVFATEAATSRVLQLYQNCPATQMVIGPADVGG